MSSTILEDTKKGAVVIDCMEGPGGNSRPFFLLATAIGEIVFCAGRAWVGETGYWDPERGFMPAELRQRIPVAQGLDAGY